MPDATNNNLKDFMQGHNLGDKIEFPELNYYAILSRTSAKTHNGEHLYNWRIYDNDITAFTIGSLWQDGDLLARDKRMNTSQTFSSVQQAARYLWLKLNNQYNSENLKEIKQEIRKVLAQNQ